MSADGAARHPYPLVIAAVRIFRFESKLWREFRITAVNIRNVAPQNWTITVTPNWKWKKKRFEQSSKVSLSGTAYPLYDAVTRRRRVTFLFVDSCDRHRNFRGREQEVTETAPEFARRSVIVRRRILNVRERTCCKSKTNHSEEQLLCHRL